VRKAYHRLARLHHPDKARTPEARETNEARFKEIGNAYEILINPEKRDKFDTHGAEPEFRHPKEAEVRKGAHISNRCRRAGSHAYTPRVQCALPESESVASHRKKMVAPFPPAKTRERVFESATPPPRASCAPFTPCSDHPSRLEETCGDRA
jgi:curved DNA-binding protein CbpA